MNAEPLGKDQARHKLNHCLADGLIVYSKHFLEELLNDNLTTEDVLCVCRGGAVINAPEQDLRSGQWQYRIEGQTQESGTIAIIFTFRPNQTILITVFKRTHR